MKILIKTLIVCLIISLPLLSSENENSSFRHPNNNNLENRTIETTSPKREKALTPTGKAIQTLTLSLIESAKTDREKAKAIYDWITDNIAYDTVSFFSGNISYAGDISEITYQTKKSVCQGYSELFKRMCDFADLECAVISGFSKGYGYSPGDTIGNKSDHAWNAVKIDGQWQLIDSTWGAGHINYRNQFVRKYNKHYFLTPPEYFIYDHLPENADWQLLDNKVSKQEFSNMAQIDSDFFDLGLKLVNHKEVVIENSEEYLTVGLEAPKDVVFMANVLNFKTGEEYKDYALVQKKDHFVETTAAFPGTGDYLLRIFAKRKKDQGMYNQVLEYKVISKSDSSNGPFIKTYDKFSEKNVQIIDPTPIKRTLSSTEKYQFNYLVPGALEVAFVDSSNKWVYLTKEENIFTADFIPKKGKLGLYAKYSKDEQFSGILEYSVK
jgi:transglutaminase/protease-like cytokinesis protein 3